MLSYEDVRAVEFGLIYISILKYANTEEAEDSSRRTEHKKVSPRSFHLCMGELSMGMRLVSRV